MSKSGPKFLFMKPPVSVLPPVLCLTLTLSALSLSTCPALTSHTERQHGRTGQAIYRRCLSSCPCYRIKNKNKKHCKHCNYNCAVTIQQKKVYAEIIFINIYMHTYICIYVLKHLFY